MITKLIGCTPAGEKLGATCKLILLQGKQHLSSHSLAELKYTESGLLKTDERLACQCTIEGNITIIVPQENTTFTIF